MDCGKNHLRIRKMKNVNGKLVKPSGNEEYQIRVESCWQRRHYRLNESNNYTVELDHLNGDEWCVYEEDMGMQVTYEIDGKEVEEACVDFINSHYHEITIINYDTMPQDYGSLWISKKVYSMCGDVISSRESFVVRLRGMNYEKEIVLNPANQYQVKVENIPFGNYVVEELNGENYDVSYVVGGIESDVGNIEIDAISGRMEIRNRISDGTHILRISKWIQQGNRLIKPNYTRSFDITVSDGYAMREYTLACANRFALELEGNKNDSYSIQELDAQNVMYEVDGEMVEQVEVNMDSDHEVRIINVEEEGGGAILLRKWIEEDGRLRIPDASMSFRIRLQGYDNEVYSLNSTNNFTLRLSNVEGGYYSIYEYPKEGYDVSYEVNGVMQEDGYFLVNENEETIINMINTKEETSTNVLHVVKRIKDDTSESGVKVPQEGSFTICIEGEQGKEEIVLNRNNNYEMNYNARAGWYTIYEVDPASNVTYRLDGVDQYHELRVFVDGFNHEIMVINSTNFVNYIF